MSPRSHYRGRLAYIYHGMDQQNFGPRVAVGPSNPVDLFMQVLVKSLTATGLWKELAADGKTKNAKQEPVTLFASLNSAFAQLPKDCLLADCVAAIEDQVWYIHTHADTCMRLYIRTQVRLHAELIR